MQNSSSPMKSRLSLGFALLALGVLLVFGTPQTSDTNSYTFANEPVRVEGFSSHDSVSEKLATRIVIAELAVDLPIKKAKVIKGYWEVFEDSAAWGEGSGLPGKVGNQVIFAHAREGLFLPLKEVSVGMNIYLFTEDKWYAYQIDEIRQVYPNQIEVIAPTEDERLTLYTCSGFNDSKRLIVVAKRI